MGSEAPGQERDGREIQTAGSGGKRKKEVGTLDGDFPKEVSWLKSKR